MTLLHDSLRCMAANHADRTAVMSEGRATTFGQLDRASDALAATLQREGVQRGDRVAVALENTTDLVISIFGVVKSGGVCVPMHPGIRSAKMRFLLEDCRPKAMIAAREIANTVNQAVADLAGAPRILWGGGEGGAAPANSPLRDACGSSARPRDPNLIDHDLAAIIYTSGSTGEPKGAMLTHRNLVNTADVIVQYLGNTADDVVSCVLPLPFSYGLCQVIAMPVVGYTLLLERSFAFPFEVLKNISRHRATGLPAVPAIIARLLQMLPRGEFDLSSLKYITNAAAGLPPAHILRLRELLPHVRVFSMYGQTECTRGTFLDPDLVDTKTSSVGRGIANSEAYVVDEHGRRVGPNVTGELVIRGANVMRGYWGRPDDTARTLRDGEILGEKVLYTGDLFRTDEDGLLYFVARVDDVFKCRGEKVSPREIENVLCQMFEVSEAAVLGIEDPIDGMAIKAVLVPSDGVTLTEQLIRRHCAANLEPAMMPKHIEFRTSLPKTESGKVKKRDLEQARAPRPAR